MTPTTVAWRVLALAQWREQPLRVLVTVLVIALGVALSAAVHVVNQSALGQFGQATRRLVGEADLIVRGGDPGFDEGVYARIARLAGVRQASAVVELDVALPDQRQTLPLLGVDPLRAGAIQPQLLGEVGGSLFELFEPDAVYLSAEAAEWLGVGRGDSFEVFVGSGTRRLRVIGLLSTDAYPRRLALMDIASAQWLFDRVGRIQRVDLRLEPGTNVAALRRALEPLLPEGVRVVEPSLERDRAMTVTRAYRINLNMLALVSLLTGSFLVFSTQSLAVLRRRPALGLLRAIGLRRAELQRALIAEGLLLGGAGALLGVIGGQLVAWGVLEWLRGDFGAGQITGGELPRQIDWLSLLTFFAIGTGVASVGAWAPALEAARRPPAMALRAGDAEPVLAPLQSAMPALLLLALGIGLALLPATAGIPLFGYGAIAALLLGAVLLVPRIAGVVLARARAPGSVAAALALARLRGSLGQSTVTLAAIIVSFSLMVAMAIMVHSFRESFEQWLAQTLPAPIQWRVATGNDTASIDTVDQTRIAALDGVQAVQFQRSLQVLLDAAHPPVALLARDPTPGETRPALALVGAELAPALGQRRVWVSEAIVDLYGAKRSGTLTLPLGGRSVPFTVAGVFRDYGRSTGAIVMARGDYIALTGDTSATEGSVWVAPRAGVDAVAAALRSVGPRPGFIEVRSSDEIRALSLAAFDRAFAITYGLEAVAVAIGLLGIAFASSSNALARRAEFGMLRHVGLRRRDVLAMLAAEGLVLSAIGVLYGLLVGLGLSIILVHVVNRQSFHWSVDLALPFGELLSVSALLVLAAAATALLAGRRVLRGEAVRAVREDW